MSSAAARGQGARTTPTSPAQFNLLIRYMERHGDLCHPTSTATTNGRIQTIKSWERLVESLNADSMDGEPRDLPRWKKVWSDLKNHTKKKAARLVAGGGGGAGGGDAAGKTRLTHTELRVLRVLGMIKKKPPVTILKTLTPLQPAGGAGCGGGGVAPRVLTAISPASPAPQENELYEISFEDLVTRKRRRRHVPPLQVAVDDDGGDDFAWPEEGGPEQDTPPSPQDGDPWDCDAPTATPAAPASPRPDRSGFTSTRTGPCARAPRGARRSLRRALSALAREVRAARRGARAARRARAVLDARTLRAHLGWQRLCRRGLDLLDTFLQRQQSGEAAPAPAPHTPLVLHPDFRQCPDSGSHSPTSLTAPPAAPPAPHEAMVEPEHYIM